MKKYHFSIVSDSVIEAENAEEAFIKIKQAIENGMYNIELIDEEEIE